VRDDETADVVGEDDETEGGQGMVEYALILMLIALVLIIVVTVLGGQTSNLYSNISNGLNSSN
jgi:pilus assembly protein Flp/PilA